MPGFVTNCDEDVCNISQISPYPLIIYDVFIHKYIKIFFLIFLINKLKLLKIILIFFKKKNTFQMRPKKVISFLYTSLNG
jgi:hypothetical protein